MKPLAEIQRVLILLSMCPVDETSTIWSRLAYKVLVLMDLIFHVGGAIGALAFFYKFTSIDSVDSLFAIVLISSMVSTVLILISGFVSRNKFGAIFKNLSDIYKFG